MLNWTKMRIAICACCLIVMAIGCQKSGERSPEASMLATSVATPAAANVTSTNNSDPVFAGAGDVASCDDLAGAKATAKLLDSIPGTIFVAGDLAYPDGSAEQFTNCYGPTWGHYKARTRPSPGNHEFHANGATPYFDYFGPAAGDPKCVRTWRSIRRPAPSRTGTIRCSVRGRSMATIRR